MALEFGVLGPVEVRADDTPVALGGPQPRRVLAALVAEAGQVVAVDRLIDAVWPDSPPDGARGTLMAYVSRLRRALGEGCIVTQDPGYRLDAAGNVDAITFEALVDEARRAPPTEAVSLIDRALSLWRGRAFGEFADEWWALPHAARLEELRIVALEQRAEALIAAGEQAHAVSDLEALVKEYPLRERCAGLLMRAHDACGRQAEALRAFARFRDHLAEETGLEPSDALRTLEAAILTGQGEGADVRHGGARSRGYVLGDLLGEGAFGTVYKSTQPGVGREVAVKVIRAELADDPSFVRRFEAEGQLVANLEHAHIVPLYDFWREPGGAYLVFRLLRGGSADELVRRDGPFSLERANRVVTEIGGALASAHAAGVVHRDVKPANILFDDDGNAYLADFGIAVTDEAASSSAPSAIASAGSPLYAPPEQFQLAAPSPRGDQYSFAAMLWELLTGAAPFPGENVSTILRTKLEQPVPSLHELRPDLPRSLDAVLQRATSTRPADRYHDMANLLAAWNVAVRARTTTTTGDLAGGSQRTRSDALATVSLADDALNNPYKGLRPFGEADARHFHGRDAVTKQLVDLIQRKRFVAVVGASGSGKSSLLHAGAMPRLRERDLRVVSMLPGEHPISQLRNALLTVATREPDFGGATAVLQSVAAQADEPLVVVVDQLEELWTMTPDRERDQFLTGLAAIIADTTARVHVIVCIRADFFDRPLSHGTFGALVAVNTFALTPMSRAELHDAVVAPAAVEGVAFEPGLDDALVGEVADEPSSLPMLQFALAELFELRRGRVIGHDAYRAIRQAGCRREPQMVRRRSLRCRDGCLDDRDHHVVRRVRQRLHCGRPSTTRRGDVSSRSTRRLAERATNDSRRDSGDRLLRTAWSHDRVSALVDPPRATQWRPRCLVLE
jgi:serine/threonine protein kinase/DNA-binding SARP family transcriptional activator